MDKECSVDGCKRKHSAKGYCKKHYERFRRHGDPMVNYVRKYRRNSLCLDNIEKPENRFYGCRDEKNLLNEYHKSNLSHHEIEDIYNPSDYVDIASMYN